MGVQKGEKMKYVIGILLATFVALIHAENQPLACQDDAAAGLNWEAGRWQTRGFFEKKFILVQDGEKLTTDSVAKVLQGLPQMVKCEMESMGRVSCMDGLGGFLFFSKQSKRGAVAQTHGSQGSKEKRDSVSVSVFTCTPF
jgi:hypothetical protein